MKTSDKFLFLFGQNKPGENLFDFAVSEVHSTATTLGIKTEESETCDCPFIRHPLIKSSYTVLNVQHIDHVHTLLSRLILTKVAIEVWGGGRNYDELNQLIVDCCDDAKRKYFDEKVSFCMRVKGIGRKVQMPEQRRKIMLLGDDTLPFMGPVNLSAPDEEFYIVEDYMGVAKEESEPAFIYFGRVVGEGQRRLLDTYSLTKRKFIGNTSMDPEISFFMSNMAGVRSSSLVFDPFVGSGSILVSAAHFGAFVLGGDINYNVVHGIGKSSRHNVHFRKDDESILNNLRQYGLQSQYLDVLLSDAAQHPWRLNRPLFDAIITDPPYGIREGSRKVGLKGDTMTDLQSLGPEVPHYPEQKEYLLEQVFKDLLEFAAATLVIGGKLVYFLPVNRTEYSPEFVPTHPALKLVGNHEQVLNTHSSRRLIVMKKITNSDRTLEAEIQSNFYSESNSFRKKYFKPM